MSSITYTRRSILLLNCIEDHKKELLARVTASQGFHFLDIFCILWVSESRDYSAGGKEREKYPVGRERGFSNTSGDFVLQCLERRCLST